MIPYQHLSANLFATTSLPHNTMWFTSHKTKTKILSERWASIWKIRLRMYSYSSVIAQISSTFLFFQCETHKNQGGSSYRNGVICWWMCGKAGNLGSGISYILLSSCLWVVIKYQAVWLILDHQQRKILYFKPYFIKQYIFSDNNIKLWLTPFWNISLNWKSGRCGQ